MESPACVRTLNFNQIISYPARLHPGIKFEGKISWMYNPGHFYLQFEENTEFNRIMEQMQIEFKSGQYQHFNVLSYKSIGIYFEEFPLTKVNEKLNINETFTQ